MCICTNTLHIHQTQNRTVASSTTSLTLSSTHSPKSANRMNDSFPCGRMLTNSKKACCCRRDFGTESEVEQMVSRTFLVQNISLRYMRLKDDNIELGEDLTGDYHDLAVAVQGLGFLESGITDPLNHFSNTLLEFSALLRHTVSAVACL